MTQLDPFSVPDFHLPFGNSKHPQAARANAEATAWAVEHELVSAAVEQFAGIGFGHLAGRVSGEVPYERVVLLAEWMAWSFVLDDQHDHLIRTGELAAWRPVTDAITEHLETGRSEAAAALGNPLVNGFTDLCDRILAGMSGATAARYRAHVPLMLHSLDQEAGNRRTGGHPTVQDYILMRRHSSQILPMMDMVEAGLGLDLPQSVHDLPEFQTLTASVLDVISWGNDVFSLPKEHACGDNNNLVSLISARDGVSLPAAVQVVEARIQARIEEYLVAERRLFQVMDADGATPPSVRTAVERYVRSYEDWMIGADLWQRYECTRYSDERFAAGMESAYTRPDLVNVA
ncbi:terpene synthase family protein [Streptomyces sp. NBC_00536]|uniref:terpene synthase family protein n=1 Tax=Streptomyces sp. NBC_00536 TaxID=2975769 RepID=UPI002E807EDF|nr:terpene synthase family protein [Streptomyces sp. NBC_00536]WUC77363.1 terpene synthase family protein [Streptomyces sp. NBC_00536]